MVDDCHLENGLSSITQLRMVRFQRY